jgi:hypothetical protein
VLGAAIDPLTLAELLELTPAAAVDLCEQAFQARLLVVSGRDYEFAKTSSGRSCTPPRLSRHGWPTTGGRPTC